MKEDNFDTTKQLEWGFYFVDKDKSKLEALFNELIEKGYRNHSIKRVENKLWQLSAKKIDILTPLKLHKRNIAFNELASYCGVELYDGWDVERHSEELGL
jgi:hypothetical protein